MRTLVSTGLALSLFAAPAIAQDGPLLPGKPAGVKAANYEGDPTILIVLGAAVIIGIVVAASSSSGGGNGGNNNGGGGGPVVPPTTT